MSEKEQRLADYIKSLLKGVRVSAEFVATIEHALAMIGPLPSEPPRE